jgi:hypothetical protein
MATKFDDICDVISNIRMGPELAEKLEKVMGDYAKDNHRTMTALLRTPAFRKLWHALDYAICDSINDPDREMPKPQGPDYQRYF